MTARAVLLPWLAGLGISLGLTACGDDDGAATVPPSSQTNGAGPRASTPADGSPAAADDRPADGGPLAGATLEPLRKEPANDSVALHTDVRAARQKGFERVVFEFRDGKLPGYDIRYVERPVVQDGSGTPVKVRGEAVVLVRMLNALDADLTDDEAPSTYTGPQRLKPDGTDLVVELTRVSGFEGVLSWAIGLRGRVPFKVTELTAPARVVVDFRHE